MDISARCLAERVKFAAAGITNYEAEVAALPSRPAAVLQAYRLHGLLVALAQGYPGWPRPGARHLMSVVLLIAYIELSLAEDINTDLCGIQGIR